MDDLLDWLVYLGRTTWVNRARFLFLVPRLSYSCKLESPSSYQRSPILPFVMSAPGSRIMLSRLLSIAPSSRCLTYRTLGFLFGRRAFGHLAGLGKPSATMNNFDAIPGMVTLNPASDSAHDRSNSVHRPLLLGVSYPLRVPTYKDSRMEFRTPVQPPSFLRHVFNDFFFQAYA